MAYERYYKSLIGYFDFEDVYFKAVFHAKENDILIEVGSFLGKSAAFMVEEIDKSKKNLKFYCVDTFRIITDDHLPASLPWGEMAEDFYKRCGDNALYELFCKNIKYGPGGHHLTEAIKSISWEAASRFGDNSVYLVFIDAGHLYDAVSKDLNAYWPKIRSGGYLCGHDIRGEGVQKALFEFCNKNNLQFGINGNNSWAILKK